MVGFHFRKRGFRRRVRGEYLENLPIVESWRGGRPTRQSLTPLPHTRRNSHSPRREMHAVMAALGWGGTGKGANLSYFKASMSVNSLTESATKAS